MTIILTTYLAEARATVRKADPPARIALGEPLYMEIRRVVGLVPGMGGEPITASIPTTSIVPEAMRVPAKLTLEDAQYLSEDDLTDEELAQAAARASTLINVPLEWETIIKTANKLTEIEPERITNYAEFIAGG